MGSTFADMLPAHLRELHDTADGTEEAEAELRETHDSGEALREQALVRVARPAEQWIKLAVLAIRQLAETQDTLNADDVWALLDADGTEPPDEPRAMGAAFRAAQAAGVCEPTMVFLKSARPVCHAKPIRVWAVNRGR